MPNSKYSVMNGSLFVLNFLPVLVNGYDCSKITRNNGCSLGDTSSLNFYSDCMVTQYSVSAFIECASQNNAPHFTATDDDGGSKDFSASDVLKNALVGSNGLIVPACDQCPLAHNLQRAINDHGTENFATYLCDHYNPQNTGLCCLRECLLSMPVEHSIQALCSGKNHDLMNTPPQPESCGGDPNENSSGGSSDNTGGGSSDDTSDDTSDGDSSTATSSSDSSSPTEQTSSPSPEPTKSSSSSSTVSTTSPTANNATPTSGTSTSTSGASTSPTAQATTNTSPASRRRVTYFDLLVRLGLAVLPILAIF